MDIEGESRFTKTEKKLSIAVAILTLLVFAVVVFLIAAGPLAELFTQKCLDESLGYPGLCDSVECIDISYRSVHSADFSESPCEDFYQFACSKWQAEHPIKEDQLSLTSNINQMRDSVDIFIKSLLEQETPSDKADPGMTAVKNFYKSCLNFTNPDENELILDLLNSLGGYQTVELWSESVFDLTEVILKFLQVNAAPLFDLTLDIDAKNRERYALFVELPRHTALVPNLFHHPSQDDDLMNSEYLHYSLIPEENGDISALFNTLSQSSSTRSSPANNSSSGNADADASNNNGSSTTSSTTTVDRQVIYKMIKDSIEAKRRESLKSLVRKIGQLLRLREEEILSDSQEVAVIASNIEKIKPSERTRKFWKQQNKIYNRFTLDQLNHQFGLVNWTFLFSELMDTTTNDNGGINWHDLTIYVPYPDYLRRILQMTQYTNKRMLYNTMLMLYVKDMLHDLLPRKESRKEEESPEEPKPRWKFCVQSTKSVFAMEVSSLYMKAFKPTHLKRISHDVERIFANVKETLITFLNRSTDLPSRPHDIPLPTSVENNGNESENGESVNGFRRRQKGRDGNFKEEAIKKILKLKGNFVGPLFYLEEDFLDDAIKNIRIDPNDFLFNVKVVYRTFREHLYRLYWKKVDEERATWAFVTFPTTVNAFHIQQFNSIVIPLAFLSPPHYMENAPVYINYATVALTLAHEALHALDGSGSGFDAEGRLQDWWEAEPKGFLEEKTNCLAKQYSENFQKVLPFYKTHVLVQVDGSLTKNENLADIGGLQVAYAAYRKYRLASNQDLGSERRLPGLDLSLEQAYFLTVAQAYCANISPMGYLLFIESDQHSPFSERINGMLMNNVDFLEAYSCRTTGTKMNPRLKCTVW